MQIRANFSSTERENCEVSIRRETERITFEMKKLEYDYNKETQQNNDLN